MASQRVDAQNYLRATFVTRIQQQFVHEYDRIVENIFFIYRIRQFCSKRRRETHWQLTSFCLLFRTQQYRSWFDCNVHKHTSMLMLLKFQHLKPNRDDENTLKRTLSRWMKEKTHRKEWMNFTYPFHLNSIWHTVQAHDDIFIQCLHHIFPKLRISNQNNFRSFNCSRCILPKRAMQSATDAGAKLQCAHHLNSKEQ